MPVAFIHKYELVISDPSTLVKKLKEVGTGTPAPASLQANTEDAIAGESSSGYSDYATATVDAITITDLQMEAEIKYSTKSNSKTAPPATFKIHNLDDNTRRKITAQSSIILKAGYASQDEMPVIYIGQAIKVWSDRNITYINCGDGVNVIKNAKYNKTYPKGTSYEAIISDLLAQFAAKGIPQDTFTKSDRTAAIKKRGTPIEGSLASSLSGICNEIDYGWYVTLGKINVHPKEDSGTIEAVDLYEQNIKGYIEPQDDKSTTATFSKASKPAGIKLTTYLNGKITTNTQLNITFGEFKGTYKITSVEHKLDFRGQAWDTEITCQKAN